MTSGNELYDFIAAGLALALVFWWIMRNADGLNVFMLIAGFAVVGIGLLFVGSVFVATIAMTIYENRQIKMCQTIQERLATVRGAPNDYFGKKLRTDIEAERISCAELGEK